MSYNSKYTGEQVEEMLDQIASGEIGGGEGTYIWDVSSSQNSGTITPEEYTAIKESSKVVVRLDNTTLVDVLRSDDSSQIALVHTYSAVQEDVETTFLVTMAFVINSDYTYEQIYDYKVIPTKISELENDSKYLTNEQYNGTIKGITIEASNGLAGGGTVSADTGSTDGTIKIRGVAATNKGKLGMSVLYSGDLKDKTYQDGAAAAAAHTHSQYLTGVTINGTTKNPTSGIVDLGTVITSHQTLKTINGESIVGSGNITIEGGSGNSGNDRIAVLEISTDTLNNQFYEYGGQLNGIAEECGTTWDNICNTVSLSDLLDYITSGHLVVIFDEVLNYLRPCSIVYDQQGELLYITIPGYITLYTQYTSQVNCRSYELQINLREDTILLRRYYHTQVSSAYPEINHGTNNTTWDLAPNTFNIWGEVPELYLTLMSETPEIANEFLFQFTSGSEPTTLTIDNQIGDTDIKWANDEAPVIEANKIYQISILNGLGTVMSWDNTNLISFSVMWGMSGVLNFECEKDMTWEAFVASSYNTDSALKISNGNIWYRSYRIEDATPTSIIENGKMYTSVYND